MHIALILLFAFAGGLALSGIVANLYRILARKPRSLAATTFHYLVMVLAGPSFLLENSTRSFRAKNCSRVAYGFALVIATYWAFLIGVIVIELVL